MAQEVLTGTESVEELQRLLDVFNNRIRLIDEKKATTKPEIYQKVRGEYEAKLLEIQVLLEEKGTELEGSLNQAMADRDSLQPQVQQITAALDELELRAVIGEVTEEEKASQAQVYLDQKSDIEAKLSSLDEKIAQLSALVNKGQPSQAPAPVPTPAPAVQPAATAVPPRPQPPKPVSVPAAVPVQPAPKPAPVPQPPARPVPAAPPEPKPMPPAPLPSPSPAPEPPPTPAQATPAPLKAATNELEELEKQFASILGSSFGETPAPPSPAMEEVLPKTEAFMEPEPEPAAPPAAEAAEEESHEGELKCPKCGAYNRADNWYCEKCGNELLSAQDLFGGGK
jgi:hypothetical protein